MLKRLVNKDWSIVVITAISYGVGLYSLWFMIANYNPLHSVETILFGVGVSIGMIGMTLGAYYHFKDKADNKKRGMDMVKVKDNVRVTTEWLIEEGTIDKKVADLLRVLVQGRMNIIYGGLRGVGQSTSMNAILSDFLPEDLHNIHIVEDLAEMSFPNHRVYRHDSSKYEDISELFREVYRTNPDVILRDELRGNEIYQVIDGMNAGYTTYGVIHGCSAEDVRDRLVSSYLAHSPEKSADITYAEKEVGELVDVIVTQDFAADDLRKVTAIQEVTYNGGLVLTPIVEFDSDSDTFIFRNKLSKDSKNKMMRNGVSVDELAGFV